MPVGIGEVTGAEGFGRTLTRIGTRAAMADLVAASMRDREARVAISHAGELGREICEVVGDEMDDLALALNASAHRDHARRQDHAAVFFEHLGPDNEIGDAGLVFHRDEHDALCRAGPLPDQYEAGGFEPASVVRLHRIAAGDEAPALKVFAQERDR